ncbi:MAG TPA: metallophosphoesterase [Ktedonobacterales bacterium]
MNEFRRTDTGTRLSDVRLHELGILPQQDQPPFDIVGDVHGCIDELRELLRLLGYKPAGEGYAHPEGRRLIFVGDLVDRGPGSVDVLRIVLAMRDAGTGLNVMGNHDMKFWRWLRGRRVHIAFGLQRTISEVEALPVLQRDAFTRQLEALFDATPGYLILDAGRLVVTHGAIFDWMIGGWDHEIAHICMYGDVIGHTEHGKPIRRDWAALRDLEAVGGEDAPLIVYGHNVVDELRWVNRTIDIDTGCVYGGALSALRYPERGLVQVAAYHTYARRL